MSIATVRHIMIRIAAAKAESPIAVFTCTGEGFLNAVFGATIATQRAIAADDPRLVGVYHSEMNMDLIERSLIIAAASEA